MILFSQCSRRIITRFIPSVQEVFSHNLDFRFHFTPVYPIPFHFFSTKNDNQPEYRRFENPKIVKPLEDVDITENLNKQADKKTSRSSLVVQLALLGNFTIAIAKTLAWLHSGSSAMLSEAIHSYVDTGNQAFLWIGLRISRNRADKHHPYGYGRSVYFWSLVSAIGTFWLGAGVSLRNS